VASKKTKLFRGVNDESTVEPYLKAIKEGRAFLDTAWGRRKVVGYNDDTGWAVTNNTGQYVDQRSFMVCLSDIKIEVKSA